MDRTHRARAALPLLLLLAALLTVLGPLPGAMAENADGTAQTKAQTSEEPALELSTIDQVIGSRLGMLNGSTFDTLVTKNYKDADQSKFSYYNSNAETIGALRANKIDAMITDLPIAELAVNQNEGIGIVPESLLEDHYAYVLPKGSPLTNQLNERLEVYRKDGTIERLAQKWMGPDESTKTMPEQDWDAPNGTIVVATSPDSAPISYTVNNRTCGLCIELLEMMAKDLGYQVEYRTTNSGSLIAEVQAGKADVAAGSFSITEERKKMVDMTDPFYDGGVTAVVRTKTPAGSVSAGFFAGLAESFKRTFVMENRWQLILSGLGVTLLISVASGALGLLLGFVLLMLRRNGSRVADTLIRAFEGLLGGLPVVVVLMIFYYVVFGAIDIPGIIVAILVFTLLFAASSGSIMWNAVQAIDSGQNEAGRALGFGDRDTFFLVVLPQAARNFAPLLRSQFVSLIKDTSVVGFIAVQDLTRVSDLIRARTMEAFFPLIATAIIYFVLCWLAARIINVFIKRLEPADSPRTIKGVEL
ncbi:MAG: ABC transporter substrate-binding protein/permease [Coriobacteriales bacterium]|nr:ABC transporter substrate-binding protein/permease [Coriobacteriales bacterium]